MTDDRAPSRYDADGKDLLLDEGWLRRGYLTEAASTREIAAELGVSGRPSGPRPPVAVGPERVGPATVRRIAATSVRAMNVFERGNRRVGALSRASLWVYRQWWVYLAMGTVIFSDWVAPGTARREHWFLVPAVGLWLVGAALFVRWRRQQRSRSAP